MNSEFPDEPEYNRAWSKYASLYGHHDQHAFAAGWKAAKDDMLAAAIESARESLSRPWQSMDTAPKDGTRIIVCWGGVPINAYYLKNQTWEGWKTESLVPQPQGKPTHWQPMPLPPIR